ncbi:MAG: polymer-forming cytoskeletal protein [Elusimicrobiota bacterium]|nr:polymer-forming cytoskeletal protein [Elusimicrobiota bacterium]
MFGSKKKSAFGKIETLISQDTKIDGVIETNGTLRVDGTVRGGISKADGVIIGDTGIVEGDIYSNGVNLAGKVTGNIYSEDMLQLLPSSILIGDIKTAQLSISEGAHFDGVCTMIEERGEAYAFGEKEENSGGENKESSYSSESS